MIAGEVGEHRGAERKAAHPLLHQGVRRNLERRVGDALVRPFPGGAACRSSDSGVVSEALLGRPAMRVSTVPRSPVVFELSRRAASIRKAVVVLPFVPVTPARLSLSAGRSK